MLLERRARLGHDTYGEGVLQAVHTLVLGGEGRTSRSHELSHHLVQVAITTSTRAHGEGLESLTRGRLGAVFKGAGGTDELGGGRGVAGGVPSTLEVAAETVELTCARVSTALRLGRDSEPYRRTWGRCPCWGRQGLGHECRGR